MNATETKPAPTLPYSVKEFPYGVSGRMMPTKVYASGMGGELLTPEELQVWEYMECLREENAKLKAEMEAATAPSEPKKGKGK